VPPYGEDVTTFRLSHQVTNFHQHRGAHKIADPFFDILLPVTVKKSVIVEMINPILRKGSSSNLLQ